MSKSSSDAKQRRSKKYRELHEKLRQELEAKNVIKPEQEYITTEERRPPWWAL